LKGLATRVIARLDIKAPNLVKGIHLEGLRVIGDPGEHALRYYELGADELVYIDIVASLYERNSLADLVEQTASRIFVPLTVGGGVRSLEDIHKLLRAGADKVAINTAATRRPELIREASRKFGSQCVVLSVEAKRNRGGAGWEAWTDNGRERTGRDVVEWIQEGVALGAGEVLLTSVDMEGTRKGLDVELIEAIARKVNVPVIASGGAGSPEHVVDAVQRGADGVALATLFHYRERSIADVKEALSRASIEVRS
jgi:imidazole glycerol-phosphate synthase subunit HisF